MFCDIRTVKHLLGSFKNFKCLNIVRCYFDESLDWKILFENNRSLESICVEILERESSLHLNSLNQLDRLTKLILRGERYLQRDLNMHISALANKEAVKELHLKRYEVNANTFDILSSFDKLQVLIIGPSVKFELNPSIGPQI